MSSQSPTAELMRMGVLKEGSQCASRCQSWHIKGGKSYITEIAEVLFACLTVCVCVCVYVV